MDHNGSKDIPPHLLLPPPSRCACLMDACERGTNGERNDKLKICTGIICRMEEQIEKKIENLYNAVEMVKEEDRERGLERRRRKRGRN